MAIRFVFWVVVVCFLLFIGVLFYCEVMPEMAEVRVDAYPIVNQPELEGISFQLPIKGKLMWSVDYFEYQQVRGQDDCLSQSAWVGLRFYYGIRCEATESVHFRTKGGSFPNREWIYFGNDGSVWIIPVPSDISSVSVETQVREVTARIYQESSEWLLMVAAVLTLFFFVVFVSGGATDSRKRSR